MNDDVIITAYEARGERWVFLWHPHQLVQVLRKAATYAANPDMDFTWRDLWLLNKKCVEAIPEAAT